MLSVSCRNSCRLWNTFTPLRLFIGETLTPFPSPSLPPALLLSLTCFLSEISSQRISCWRTERARGRTSPSASASLTSAAPVASTKRMTCTNYADLPGSRGGGGGGGADVECRYIAPEIIGTASGGGGYGLKSDIWSMGVRRRRAGLREE